MVVQYETWGGVWLMIYDENEEPVSFSFTEARAIGRHFLTQGLARQVKLSVPEHPGRTPYAEEWIAHPVTKGPVRLAPVVPY